MELLIINQWSTSPNDKHEVSSNDGHGHGDSGSDSKNCYNASLHSRSSFRDTRGTRGARQRSLQHVEQMLDECAVPSYPRGLWPRTSGQQQRRGGSMKNGDEEECWCWCMEGS